MTTYVALLRGVNVGGRIIKMADLKACFESLGLAEVRTVLQSGNVVFASDKSAGDLKELIEKGLTTTFNYPAKVQVLELGSVSQIVADSPYKPYADHHSYVVFLENGLEKELAAAANLDPAVETATPGNGVLYWQVVKGMTLKSQLGKTMSKAKFAPFLTNRKIQTLQKILTQ